MFEQLFRYPYTFLLAVVLAAVPALVWGYFFYRKNPTPIASICMTFFAGMLGIIPLVVYQLSWYDIPDISIHYFIPQLITSPGWYSAIVFIIISQVIAFFMSAITALMMLVIGFVTMTKGIVSNVIESFTKEDSNFRMIGVLLAIFSIMIIWLDINPVEALIVTVSLAALEEFVKHLIVRFIDDNRIRSIDDAIWYSILVGIGFATIENLFFFFNGWFSGELLQIFFFRALVSTFGHIFFSGVFGYFYGMAHFATPLYYDEVYKHRGPISRFFERVFHMRGDVFFHESKMLQGLLYATVLHTIFNFLVKTENYIVLIPFMFIGFFLLSYLFEIKEDQKEFRFVGTQRTTGKVHLMEPKYD